MSIAPLGAAAPAIAFSAATASTAAGAGDSPFAKLVGDLIHEANGQQVAADQSLEQLVSGENDNVHDVVLTMAKADMAFRLVLEIRNRLIESYQEIMRMQV
jgi:flagellar hook-basal body complex protein FliE